MGILSGLLGLGGGIILAPTLLYLPPVLGLGPLDMRAVAGLTMTHALFASLSAAWRHQQSHMICWPLVRWMGFTIFVASFVGATASKAVSTDILQAVFALLAFVAGVIMVLPQKEFTSARADASFSRPLAVGIAGTIGALGGLVGQGGSFLLIPSIVSLLQVPLRIAVGTNLPIVALASLSGFSGKLMTHQIPVEIGLALVFGAVPGAQIGSVLSRRAPTPFLRGLLATIIILVAVSMGYQTLQSK